MTETIFITGTSSGFGKAASELFASKGWNVVATMRKPDDSFQELKNVLTLRLDVTKQETIDSAISEAVKRFGNIDVLLNNAGFAVNGIFESTSEEDIYRQFDTNLFGVMRVTKAVLPIMRKQGSGLIINLSSMGGKITLPMLSLYHASKFALEGFSESLSYELTSQNIKVKLIEPGSATTDFAGRSMTVTDNSSISDYQQFINDYSKARANYLSNQRASAIDIANQIFKAATDKTDKMRYIVGEDAKSYIDFRDDYGEDAFVAKIKRDFKIE